MGIGNGQASLLATILDGRPAGTAGTVCEYGAQVPNVAELAALRRYADATTFGEVRTAHDLYHSLGFSEYVTFDINGEYDALVFDMNRDIRKEYGYIRQFDVVTNFGTAEHCFNQFQVFKNIHDSCMVGGLMLHTAPSQGWGKHCFFRYDTNVFLDMSKANGYEVIRLEPFFRLKSYRRRVDDKISTIQTVLEFVRSRIASGAFEGDDPYYRGQPIYKALQAVGVGGDLFHITLGCILRKTRDAPFATPIQGSYQV